MVGFGRDPTRLFRNLNKLSVDILIRIYPNDTIWILIAITIGVFDRQLRLTKSSQPAKGRRLTDRRTLPFRKLFAHILDHLLLTNNFISLLLERNIENRPMWSIVRNRNRSSGGFRYWRGD